jgi:NAD(P)-dependent dehydrogenase (short-subunit alcohol dehydrogenase family)
MADRLKGKIALISGGATGCGAAAARLFAAEGAAVGIIDRNERDGAALAAELVKAGYRASFARADVSKKSEVEGAVAQIVSALGPINVLFNHAGTIVIKPFLETEEEDWDMLFDVNVKSMYLMTRAVLPHMLAQGKGAIVCTSSISAVYATPMEVLYDATKGACHMFARAIAVEFRDRGIRCNAVCPGFIETPHGLREVKELTAHGVDVSEDAIRAAQGRLGKPEDIARAALYLGSGRPP